MFSKRSTVRELEATNGALLRRLNSIETTQLAIYFDDCASPSFIVSLAELADTAVEGTSVLHFKYSEVGIDRGAPIEQSEPYKGL